ncbi:unnamed protein product [Darwinula stevensoni]|uniref:magnesium chelatase n=1 Tax=Darwinula stevensoni TaxID=69355 RepID=A0A7R9AJG0_9CRUS|nr:unnamed protein product [Darwinula stevensoni]CAG0908212.1 unnamed protein product [Darwinula stevensoni]
MQEKQTTIDGKTYALPQPFMVLATQNPIEQDGTYPLPQAQLDRFMGKILIDYPSEDEEQALLARIANSQDGLTPDMQLNVLEQVLTLQELQDMQTQVAQVRCDQQILNYIVAIVRATRKHYGLDAGAGPRATMGLLQAARAHALLQGRAFVIPDDVKNCAPMVLRHRLRLSAELAIEGRKDDELVQEILEKIDAPRQ